MTASLPSARERLLEVAGRLFYAEGIHAVGVDRVIAEADVAKATLYAHFTGKDELVASYLARQSERWVADVEARSASCDTGSTQCVLTPFDVLAERAAAPGYRGCPFINAAAEFPGPGPVAEQIAAHRCRARQLFSHLLASAGASDRARGALIVLYDGAMSAAYLDRDPGVVADARSLADMFLTQAPRTAPAGCDGLQPP